MSARNQDTKALIAELQHDRDNCIHHLSLCNVGALTTNTARQVNEILRGKLHILSAQLADAQERVKAFEAKQIADEGKMNLWTRQLSEAGKGFASYDTLAHYHAGERNVSLVSKLDAREHETMRALADAARLEEKLASTEER